MSHSKASKSILILGAGGGNDVLAGFGLGLGLEENMFPCLSSAFAEKHTETKKELENKKDEKKTNVHWANYSWTDRLDTLDPTTNSRCTPFAIKVTPETVPTCQQQRDYFPEWALAKQLQRSVWAIRGVPPPVLVHTLDVLVKRLNVDTIVCVDAGSDAVLFGDEKPGERGSPTEEMTVLSSVYYLLTNTKSISNAFVACISVRFVFLFFFFIDTLTPFFRFQVPTEEIPLSNFFHRLGKVASAGGLLMITPFPSRYRIAYGELLDRVQSNARSVPNECILASLDNRLSATHLINERLYDRLGDDPNEYPPVLEWTKNYFVMDVEKLVLESNLLFYLHRLLCDQIELLAKRDGDCKWMELDDDSTQLQLVELSKEFHQTVMCYFDASCKKWTTQSAKQNQQKVPPLNFAK